MRAEITVLQKEDTESTVTSHAFLQKLEYESVGKVHKSAKLSCVVVLRSS